MKYIPESEWSCEDHRKAADRIIDNIQIFISQDGDVEGAMSDSLQLFTGRGKVRQVLAKTFQDKNAMAAAFRTFLFEASPKLKAVSERLSVQPQELSDKIKTAMQGAIYTWTEEQVKSKLDDIAEQYKYLEVIGKVQGTTYHSIDAARNDLVNQFSYLRIPMAAIEQLNKPWYPALKALRDVVYSDTSHMTGEQRQAAVSALEQYGIFAEDCLKNGKAVLEDILNSKNIECTPEELDTVYGGLKGINHNTALTQFNKELEGQLGKISFARNKTDLSETWKSITGTESVKDWCSNYNVPLMWIIPKELNNAFRTLIDVQNGSYTVDKAVVSALNSLRNMDTSVLTDRAKIENSFVSLVGEEYSQIWVMNRTEVMTEAKLKIGNDMSTWTAADLTVLQGILKRMKQDKAKKEKLAGTKNSVRNMKDDILRDLVTAFLDLHPEYCDDFIK